jgi:GNAT superfamily N-acetyltransferase
VARSPDAGRVAFTYRFSADLLAVMQALGPRVEGALATAGGAPVGMIFGDFSELQWSGARRPGVYVSNLRVHPEHRRRGVAAELARFGLELARERLGADGVVYAAVLEGNLSTGLVQGLGFQATPPIRGALVPLRRSAPRASRGLELRPAAPEDAPQIAAGMNAFHAAHNLWSPVSADSLAAWVAREVGGVRPNRLYVAARAGEVVAGLSASDRTALVRMVVTRASPLVRAAGRAIGILPADGALRALTVRQLWFRPGELPAARLLWQTLRATARGNASCLGIAYDPRDPVAGVFRLPPWLPTFPARYLVRARAALEPERPTYCIAGA